MMSRMREKDCERLVVPKSIRRSGIFIFYGCENDLPVWVDDVDGHVIQVRELDDVRFHSLRLMIVEALSSGSSCSIIYGEGADGRFMKGFWDIESSYLHDMHPRMIMTIDIAPVAMIDDVPCIGFVRRRDYPFMGKLSLPGCFVHVDRERDLNETLNRCYQKYGMATSYVEQVRSITGSGRDPRGPNGWATSILYMGLMSAEMVQDAMASETEEWHFLRYSDIIQMMNDGELAFDHGILAMESLTRYVDKATYTALPIMLLPEQFTMPEVIDVYRKSTRHHIDQSSFRRKLAAQSPCLFNKIKTGKTLRGRAEVLSLNVDANMTFSKPVA